MEESNKGFLARQMLHASVFSQSFSPCGNFLAAADNYGYISLFNLKAALGPNATEKSHRPCFRFKAHDGPIYSLVSSERILISAGSGDIKAWNWADITTKAPRTIWSLPIKTESRFDTPETNSVILTSQGGTNHLVAGCGDNNVYVWDVDSGRLLNTLKGHTEYVHKVAHRSNGTEIVSASEDGSVRIWDLRTGSDVHRIEPYKNEICARPHLGRWLGCVSVDPADDWLVCGGGPHLSLWYLRSMSCTSICNTPRTVHQHVMFHDDSVISGGSDAFVYHWAMNGDEKSHVPCSPTSVFNIVINTKPESQRALSVAGNSAKIDICTNFGYKTLSLSII